MMQKLRLFLFSQYNLCGLAVACIGPALVLADVIGRGWPLVSMLGYGVGYAGGVLLFPQAVIEQQAEMSLEDLQGFLSKLLREHSNRLPQEAVAHLKSIADSLEQALPRFKEMFESTGTGGEGWMVFRQVILSYLPQTIGNYLRLPAKYAATHIVGNTGKTPHVLLVSQLKAMDTELIRATQTMFESDANQMLIDTTFLERKFGRVSDFMD
jgi:hypothetical protein